MVCVYGVPSGLYILDVWRLIDKNGDNQLSHHELWNGLKALKVKIKKSAFDDLMAHIDTDRDGDISYNEFRVQEQLYHIIGPLGYSRRYCYLT